MGAGFRPARRAAAALCVLAAVCGAPPASAPAFANDIAANDIARGRYLVAAGGCLSCHTDLKARGPAYAGGAALKTPFGMFFAPNITPHRTHGIGAWSEADFVRAMRRGVAPDGSHYFPVFPYTAFTGVSDSDLAAMYAYLMSLDAVDRANRPHAVDFPFGWRFLQVFWKWLFFEPGPYRPDPGKSAQWNRGAYLVQALAHCGECHTGRNALGGLDHALWLAGAAEGPEGEATPNLTPDGRTGLGNWSEDELATYLNSGMDPDGDFAGALMADVIEHGTGRLTEADIAAIVAYLRALPPVENEITPGD